MFSRNERIKELMAQELARALRSVKDPGVSGMLTVTGLDLSPDRKKATVHFSVLGDAVQRKSTAHALRRAAPFLRRTMAKRLCLKVIPELIFSYDETPETASRVEMLLLKISKEKK